MKSNKSHSAWNFGLTKETDERVRKYGEKQKGKVISDETRQKQRQAHLGMKLSPESIFKTSSANKRLYASGKIKVWNKGLTKETDERVKNNAGFTGRKHSEESKLKTKKSLLGRSRAHLHESYLRAQQTRVKTTKERGYYLSEEARKKISQTRIKNGVALGNNNPNWQGGNSFEPYTQDFNTSFKNSIRKRDNQICTNCGKHREQLKEALHVHHVNYDKELTIPENCISLCNSCHGLTQINREYWTKLFQEKLAQLYGYKYENGKIVLKLEETKS